MNKRLAHVDDVKVTAISIGSGFLIGDLTFSRARSKALAVQEETTSFTDWADFDSYPIFQRDLPPARPVINIDSSFHNHHPSIIVHNIKLKGISTAGLFQIGGIDHIEGEGRLKHIRILSEEQ
ncbi:spore germination protein GerPE [Halobacillus seohaensis]|uniref:Spore germination protein GerPE n=1 Tax=Halobacillus seohaensis TaxID=447421 RepID=A0ABW2EHX8_9BACI